MTFVGRRVVFSGPFRARLALTLTDAADRDRWDEDHREAVAADFLDSWDDLGEQADGLRALVVTSAAPFPAPGVVVYVGKPLEDGETIEVRGVAQPLAMRYQSELPSLVRRVQTDHAQRHGVRDRTCRHSVSRKLRSRYLPSAKIERRMGLTDLNYFCKHPATL